jgi:hypothetical protein
LPLKKQLQQREEQQQQHQSQIQPLSSSPAEEDIYSSELSRKIAYITQYNSKPYFRNALMKMSEINPENAGIICDYIIAEQTEMNIKESTKEGKIKVLVWLSNHFRGRFRKTRNTGKRKGLGNLNTAKIKMIVDSRLY